MVFHNQFESDVSSHQTCTGQLTNSLKEAEISFNLKESIQFEIVRKHQHSILHSISRGSSQNIPQQTVVPQQKQFPTILMRPIFPATAQTVSTHQTTRKRKGKRNKRRS